MNQLLYRLRPINLFLVALTQLFFYYVVLKPFLLQLDKGNLSKLIDFHYWILVSITLIVTFGGYLINDISDLSIDQINKPSKAIKNVSLWTSVYKLCFTSGLALTVYLSYLYSNIYFLAIYLLSWCSLYFYSTSWKCRPLVGNLVVALFSSLVVLAVLGLEYEQLIVLNEISAENLLRPFLYFSLFSFLTSLVREIIKDMEDYEGDRKNDCRTLAVDFGLERTKVFVVFFSGLLLFSLVAWQWRFASVYPLWAIIYLNVFVCLPVLFVIWKVFGAFAQKDFRLLSTILKLIMLAGIAFLVVELYI